MRRQPDACVIKDSEAGTLQNGMLANPVGSPSELRGVGSSWPEAESPNLVGTGVGKPGCGLLGLLGRSGEFLARVCSCQKLRAKSWQTPLGALPTFGGKVRGSSPNFGRKLGGEKVPLKVWDSRAGLQAPDPRIGQIAGTPAPRWVLKLGLLQSVPGGGGLWACPGNRPVSQDE